MSSECTAELTGCCKNELLHSNVLKNDSIHKKGQHLCDNADVKYQTSLYSAEVYSGYNYATKKHKTNFPTMQRWCKHACLIG